MWHQNVFVAPVGNVNIKDLLRVGGAAGRPGRVHAIGLGQHTGRAIDGLVELPVAVTELVQRHVAGAVEHGPALGIGELRKAQILVVNGVDLGVVTGWNIARRNRTHLDLLVARVAPIDLRDVRRRIGALTEVVVEVINTFNQDFQELAIIRCIGVVVANLAQRHVHGLVATAHHHEFGANLLGDLGWHVTDRGHLGGAGYDLDGINHHLHVLGGGDVVCLGHAVKTRDGGSGIKRDRAASQQRYRASGVERALALDQDIAAGQGAARQRSFHDGARPGHVDTGMQHDVASRTDGAANLHQHPGAEQSATGGARDFDHAVDDHAGRNQVQQFVGLGNGRIQCARATRHQQRFARCQVQGRVGARGVDVAAREQADIVALDFKRVLHVDVAHQVDVTRERDHAHGANLGLTERGGQYFTLADDAGHRDAIDRFDVDAAASGGVERAARNILVVAVENDFLHPDADTTAVGAAAQRQAVVGGHQTADVNHRTRAQHDVRTCIQGADSATGQQIAIGDDADLTGHAGAAGIDGDAAQGGHRKANAAGRCARLDVDQSGGVKLAAKTIGNIADNNFALRLDAQTGCRAGQRRRGSGVKRHALNRRVVGEGVVLAGQQRALRVDCGAADLDQTGVARTVELRVVGNRYFALGQQAQAAVGLHDHGTGVAGRCAQRDGVTSIEFHRMAWRLRAQHHVVDADVVAGIDLHRAHQANGAVQGDTVAGVDRQLIVVSRGGSAVAAHHAGDVNVLAREQNRRARFEPARRIDGTGEDAQVALARTHLQQRQVLAGLADGVANQHVVQTREHDAAARRQALEVRAAVGAQADLTGLLARSGVDQDVALRRQIALEEERAGAVDDDVGIGTAGDEIALNRNHAGRVHDHRTAQGLDQAGSLEVDRQATGDAGASVHVDAAVGTDGAGNGDHAGGCIGLAQVDDRAALAGVDGVGARRSLVAAGRATGRDLGKAQTFGATATGERCGKAQLEIAGEHQTPVVQTHRHFAVGCRGVSECRIDRLLQIGHQVTQAMVAVGAVSCHTDVGHVVGGTALNGQIEAGCGAQVAVGKLGKAVSHDLLRPGWRQYRHIAAGRQADGTVFLPGAELHVTAHHQAFVGPGVNRGASDGVVGDPVAADTATHVNGFARQQVAPEADLLVGGDADHRVAGEVAHGTAEVIAGRVVAVDDFATGQHLTLQPGVLRRVDGQHAIGVGHGDNGGARQAHADVVGIGATRELNQGAGPYPGADFNDGTGERQRVDTQVELAAGSQPHGGFFARPVDGFPDQSTRVIEVLGDGTARQHHAAEHHVANGVDCNQATRLVAGPARCGQTGNGIEDDARVVVIRTGRTGRDQADRLGR